MTVILIAVSRNDAEDWWNSQPIPPQTVVVITPRSPHGARGNKADAVLATPSALTHRKLSDLIAEAAPAVET